MFLYNGSSRPGAGSSVANWLKVSATIREASGLTYIKLFAMVGSQGGNFGAESGITEEMRAVHHFDLQLLL